MGLEVCRVDQGNLFLAMTSGQTYQYLGKDAPFTLPLPTIAKRLVRWGHPVIVTRCH